MTKTDQKNERITAKRRARIEKEFEAMAQGIWSNEAIARHVGVSPATVKRDLQHPYALEYPRKLANRRMALADQLLRRQIEQIESGAVKPHIQLLYRGRALDKLLPSKIMQKIGGEIETKLEVKPPEFTEEDFARYVPVIVKVAMGLEAKELSDDTLPEDPEQPMDRVDPTPDDGAEGPE